MATKTLTIEIRKAAQMSYLRGRDEYWFRIVAGNGKILCHSEMYTRKASAIKTAQLIIDKGGSKDILLIDDTGEKK